MQRALQPSLLPYGVSQGMGQRQSLRSGRVVLAIVQPVGISWGISQKWQEIESNRILSSGLSLDMLTMA